MQTDMKIYRYENNEIRYNFISNLILKCILDWMFESMDIIKILNFYTN